MNARMKRILIGIVAAIVFAIAQQLGLVSPDAVPGGGAPGSTASVPAPADGGAARIAQAKAARESLPRVSFSPAVTAAPLLPGRFR